LKSCFEILEGLHRIQEEERKEENKEETIVNAKHKVIQPHVPPQDGWVVRIS
jgi:hypothetical protein